MSSSVIITVYLTLMIGISNQQNAGSSYVQNTSPLFCPSGYSLINGLCYRTIAPIQNPCQQYPCTSIGCPCPTIPTPPITPTPPTTQAPTTALPTTQRTTVPTTQSPTDCPNKLVRIDGVCRLMYCPKGELHEGRCIEPKCNNGTVWLGGRCTAPEMVRTILEIETHFTTHTNHTEPVIEKPKVTNDVTYHTEAPEIETTPKRCPSKKPKTEIPPPRRCCRIVSPRTCRVKLGRWLCSHRNHLRCDDFCGNSTLVFLTIPEVTEYDGVVLMPPNLVLDECDDTDCTKEGSIDCSGCISGHRKTCSTYCYRFHCPKTFCHTMDQAEYCKEYTDDSACTRSGGCFQESCYNDSNCVP